MSIQHIEIHADLPSDDELEKVQITLSDDGVNFYWKIKGERKYFSLNNQELQVFLSTYKAFEGAKTLLNKER